MAQAGAGGGGDVLEALPSQAAVQHGRLAVAQVAALERLDLGKDVTVHQQYVAPAVIVGIQEAAAPAHESRIDAEAVMHRRIVEIPAAAIGVQGRALVGEIGAEDIVMAVAIDIPGRHAHAGERLSMLVKGSAAQDRLVPEGAVALVDVQDRRRAVAGDVDVRPAVAVKVAANGSERVIPSRGADAAGKGCVREAAGAVIAQELIAGERQPAGPAGDWDVAIEAVRVLARLGRPLEIEFEVVGDKKVEVAVPVGVEEGAACAVAAAVGNRQALEPRAGPIAVETVLSPISNEQVGEPVVVHIAHAGALAPAFATQPRALGHVGEAPPP